MRILSRLVILIVVAIVALLPAYMITIYLADEVCRGTDCALTTLVVGGPVLWGVLTGLGCLILWWRARG